MTRVRVLACRCKSLCRALCAAVALSIALSTAYARAGEPTEEEIAAARSLFKEAMDLEAADNWTDALEKLERVAQVKMTPQVRYHIALCHESLGRLVEAINGFELAEQEAKSAGDAALSVLQNAPERAAKLRLRVAQIRIVVSGRLTVSTVFINGRSVSPALMGTNIPVDPGAHVIEVRRDGKVTHHREAELAEAGAATIELTVDDPERLPDPEPVLPTPRPRPNPEGPTDLDPLAQVPAYVVGGAGAVMLIASGALWGLRNKTIDNVRCTDPEGFTGCDPDDEPTADLARRYDIASKVMLGVGLGTLATGVALWFILAPSDGDPAKPAGIGIGPMGTGARIVGQF